MKTYSRLTLAFLLLILVVPQVDADEPPENGPYVEYYENGKKKLQTNLKNGEQDGRVTEWHKNGQKKSDGYFRNGKRDGAITWWYKNGQKQFVGHWNNGEQDGRVTEWHKNGQKKAAGHFKNGERDGLATWWNENGQKTREIHYTNGLPGRQPIANKNVPTTARIKRDVIGRSQSEVKAYFGRSPDTNYFSGGGIYWTYKGRFHDVDANYYYKGCWIRFPNKGPLKDKADGCKFLYEHR